MTTYTAIPDSDIDPESPGTTTLFTRLRDNPLAIQEGDASAPSIANAALAGYPFSNSGGDISDPGWVKVSSWTPTAVSGRIFTWDETTYSDVRVVIEGVRPSTNNDVLTAQFGYNNGASFLITGYGYSYYDMSASPSLSGGSGSAVSLVGQVGNSYGMSASIEVVGSYTTISGPSLSALVNTVSSSGLPAGYQVTGTNNTTTARTSNIDSIKLIWTSGNFAASIGTITLYGLMR